MKILVIGLDGATFDLIKPWADAGELPTFKKLMEEGVWGELESTIPHITPPAWTSITTGKNPGKHGIFDFMSIERKGNEWKLRLYDSTSKKSKEIWDYLSEKRSIIVNVPLTYPPRPINGIMITGMYTPGMDKEFTYPPEVKKDILRLFPKYRIELNWNEYKGKKEQFLKDLYSMTKERINLFWYLFKKNWDFFFFVFVGTDRLQHIMWEKKELLEYYKYLDKFLDDVIEEIKNKNFILYIVSDYGFSKLKRMVYPNTFLIKEGYLKIKNSAAQGIFGLNKEKLSELLIKYKLYKIYNRLPPKLLHFIRTLLPGKSNPVYDFDLESSKAIMVGSGGIFITNQMEKDKIKYELITKFTQLQDDGQEEKIFDGIFSKEEIYSGSFLEKAPDLLLLPKKGYSIISKLSDRCIDKPDFKKADHALDGIFLAYGPGIKKGYKIEGAKIYDIAPTILHMFGLPIPNDMDGRVLTEIFEDDSEFTKRKPEYIDPDYYEKEEKEKIKEKIKKLKLKGKI